MGQSQSLMSMDMAVGYAQRAECRRPPEAGCFSSEYEFLLDRPPSRLLVAAGLTLDAFKNELEELNAVWRNTAGTRQVPYEFLSFVGFCGGLAGIIVSTQTQSTGSGGRTPPDGVVFGIIMVLGSVLVFFVARHQWRKRVKRGIMAVATHISTAVGPRWAQRGITWRVSSNVADLRGSETRGSSSTDASTAAEMVYFIEAAMTDEALAIKGLPPRQRIAANPLHVALDAAGVPVVVVPQAVLDVPQTGQAAPLRGRPVRAPQEPQPLVIRVPSRPPSPASPVTVVAAPFSHPFAPQPHRVPQPATGTGTGRGHLYKSATTGHSVPDHGGSGRIHYLAPHPQGPGGSTLRKSMSELSMGGSPRKGTTVPRRA